MFVAASKGLLLKDGHFFASATYGEGAEEEGAIGATGDEEDLAVTTAASLRALHEARRVDDAGVVGQRLH